MFLLPHFKRNKGHKVTGKCPVYAMIFCDDLVTQHPGVLILALLVDRDRTIAYEIVARIDYPAVGVEAVAVVVYMVSQHIKTPTNGNRDI